MDRELNVALFKKGTNADGATGYWRVGFDFALSHFGGVLPDKGDAVVPYLQGVRKPEEQIIFTVEERIFRPVEKGFINVALVVSERRSTAEEANLVFGGG